VAAVLMTPDQVWTDTGENLPDDLMRVRVACDEYGAPWRTLASWDGQAFSVHCGCGRWHDVTRGPVVTRVQVRARPTRPATVQPDTRTPGGRVMPY
jgi:hypothetical protein